MLLNIKRFVMLKEKFSIWIKVKKTKNGIYLEPRQDVRQIFMSKKRRLK